MIGPPLLGRTVSPGAKFLCMVTSPSGQLIAMSERSRVWRPLPRSFLSWLRPSPRCTRHEGLNSDVALRLLAGVERGVEFGLDGPETLLHFCGGKDSGAFACAGSRSLGGFLFEGFSVGPFGFLAASVAFLQASLNVCFHL